jgi:aminoglycoside phosphotransferase (APT) family kinase protein
MPAKRPSTDAPVEASGTGVEERTAGTGVGYTHYTAVLELGDFADAERATGGFDTTVWRVRLGTRTYALRVFRPEQAPAMRRELSALRAAARGGIAVPHVRLVGTVDDARPAMLLDWCPGRTLMDAIRARAPDSVLRLGVLFGRMQRRIHEVPAPDDLRTTWSDWPSPIDSDLRYALQAASTHRSRLLHFDFHPLNVLVDGGRISAVLDWVNAHGGDPRADVARTLTILRFAPPRGRAPERAMRRLLELAWRAGYGPFGRDMPLFYAWAGTAMQQDLKSRVPPSALAPVARWTATWLHRLNG